MESQGRRRPYHTITPLKCFDSWQESLKYIVYARKMFKLGLPYMGYTCLISWCMYPSYPIKHELLKLIRPNLFVYSPYNSPCSHRNQPVRVLRPFNSSYCPNGKTSTHVPYSENSIAKSHPNLTNKGSYCAGASYLPMKKDPPRFRWVVLEISKKRCREVMFVPMHK